MMNLHLILSWLITLNGPPHTIIGTPPYRARYGLVKACQIKQQTPPIHLPVWLVSFFLYLSGLGGGLLLWLLARINP